MAQITLNSTGVASSGALALQSNGTTTAVTIDASQNVGIGVSPAAKLDISGSTSAANRSLRIIPTTEADSVLNLRTSTIQRIATDSVLAMGYATTPDAWYISASYGSTGAYKPLAFATSDAERMRIDSSGNLMVGTTSLLSGSERFALSSSAADWTQVTRNSNASPYGMLINYSSTPNGTSNAFISCYDNNVGSQRFTVRSNGGIANYTANDSPLSDRRLKKNITPAGSYLDKICAIPVVTYFYNDQTDDLPNLGVIAQDVQLAAPELCNEEGWGTKAEDGSTYLGIWETDIQYALMKSIQELKALVDTQSSTITQLQADVAALKGTA
jgi:hypothetical protein